MHVRVHGVCVSACGRVLCVWGGVSCVCVHIYVCVRACVHVCVCVCACGLNVSRRAWFVRACVQHVDACIDV